MRSAVYSEDGGNHVVEVVMDAPVMVLGASYRVVIMRCLRVMNQSPFNLPIEVGEEWSVSARYEADAGWLLQYLDEVHRD